MRYKARLADDVRSAFADEDLVKGILTNLLENAAEAAGAGGRILGVTSAVDGKVAIEVHDSGPGLSEQARGRCSSRRFRSRSAAWAWGCRSRERARCCPGGDILLVKGELGGAGFACCCPSTECNQTNPDRG